MEKEIKDNYKDCLKWCKKYTKNTNDAEALRSIVLEKAWNNRAKFKQGMNFKSWLYVLVRNTFIDEYRKGKKEMNNISIDSSFVHPFENFNEERLHLQNVINNITYEIDSTFTENEVEIFKLYAYEGYKFEEIERKLNLSVVTVTKTVFKIRSHINNIKWEY